MREGARTDQAHLPLHDAPQLGQFVDREPPQPAAEPGDQARIDAQLVARLPLGAQRGVLCEVLFETPLRVRDHGADLRHPDGPSEAALAHLPVEHWPGACQPHQQRGERDHREREQERDPAEHEIGRALDPACVRPQQVVAVLESQYPTQIAELDAFDGQPLVVAEHEHPREESAQPVQALVRLRVPVHQRDPDSERGNVRRVLQRAEHGLPPSRARRAREQHPDRTEAEAGHALEERADAQRSLRGPGQYDRLGPPGEAAAHG